MISVISVIFRNVCDDELLLMYFGYEAHGPLFRKF